MANKRRSRLYKGDLFQQLVPGAKDVQFSETGLTNRVIIYRQLGVIPMFTVKALDNYEADYERWETDKPHGSHWDIKLHERMQHERFSLMPRDVVSDTRLLDLWVQCIIYDLVTFNDATGQYQIKSKALGGRPLKGWMVEIGATRVDAFNMLCDNVELVEPEIRQELAALDVPGPDNFIRRKAEEAVEAAKTNTYLQSISKCPISITDIEHYPQDAELIEREMTHLLENA